MIDIPAEAADPELLPPLLKGFKAVPPFVTDISLSLDDRFLYVSCWGTGELRQYDVSDPFSPVQTGSINLGGIVRRQPHPSDPEHKLNGGPQMVEVSRDGKRIFVTNSLYRAWDDQFYPDGIRGWLTMVNADQSGGMSADGGFLVGRAGVPNYAGGHSLSLHDRVSDDLHECAARDRSSCGRLFTGDSNHRSTGL